MTKPKHGKKRLAVVRGVGYRHDLYYLTKCDNDGPWLKDYSFKDGGGRMQNLYPGTWRSADRESISFDTVSFERLTNIKLKPGEWDYLNVSTER